MNIQQQPSIVEKTYGHRLRVRVCGICVEGNNILMVNHQEMTPSNRFYAPPGGGIEFGELATEALKREFLEETGLEIEVKSLLFVSEVLKPPLHAVELFFDVKIIGGKKTVGYDPEMPDNKQIINKVDWLNFDQIKALKPNEVHHIFGNCKKISDIYELKSYLTSQ